MSGAADSIRRRLRAHLDALAAVEDGECREAFTRHECDHCDELDRYLESLDRYRHDGEALPEFVECLATHVAAVVHLSRNPQASDTLEAELDAFHAAFEGLGALEEVPLEAPLSISLNLSERRHRERTPLTPRRSMPESTPSRLPMIFAFAAALLAGLAMWWWLGAKPDARDTDVAAPPADGRACSPAALRAAVDGVDTERAMHPARLAEVSMANGQAALLAGCPELPAGLRERLASLVVVSIDARAATLSKRPGASFEAYRELRDRTCADPSVFEELATLPPSSRARTLFERCQLARRGLGDLTEPVYGQLSIFGFVLHQFLLDDGVDPDLARDTVRILATEPLPRAAVEQLPKSSPALMWQEAVLVRVEEGFIELSGRPRIPLAGTQAPELGGAEQWLESTAEREFPGEEAGIAIQTTPSSPVHALVALMDGTKMGSAQILVAAEGGTLGAESVHRAPSGYAATHHISFAAGRASLTSADSEDPVVVARNTDGFAALEEWASQVSDREAVRLTVSATGLTVQQLVDLLRALRGRECQPRDAMLDEDADSKCGLFVVALTD